MKSKYSEDYLEWIKMMNLAFPDREVTIIKSRAIGPTFTATVREGGKKARHNIWTNIIEARKFHLNIRTKSIALRKVIYE